MGCALEGSRMPRLPQVPSECGDGPGGCDVHKSQTANDAPCLASAHSHHGTPEERHNQPRVGLGIFRCAKVSELADHVPVDLLHHLINRGSVKSVQHQLTFCEGRTIKVRTRAMFTCGECKFQGRIWGQKAASHLFYAAHYTAEAH